jgi:hypothetical protein
MRKWIIILLMVLFSIPIVISLEECKRVMNPSNIPCMFVTSMKGDWIYTNDCNTYTVEIYDSTPTLLDSRALGNYQNTRCNLTFNYTRIGSYLLNFSSRETAKIIIEEDDDMILGIVLGVGIISALLLFFAFKLDDEHTILKILFMISSITLLILIPASTFITTTSNAGKIFYRTFLYIFIAFWLYVFLYFCYWILKKFGWIVSGEEDET